MAEIRYFRMETSMRKKTDKRLPFMFLAVLMVSLIALSGCSPRTADETDNISQDRDDTKSLPSDTRLRHEIIDNDIFDIDNITADDVTILGLKLGDDSTEMIRLLGEPDVLTTYEDNTIFNCEYSGGIGLEESGLIIQIKDDRVTRITVLEPFGKYLVGSTDIFNYTRYDVYYNFGAPSRQKEDFATRIFFYDTTGIDIVLYEGIVEGISFRKLETKGESAASGSSSDSQRLPTEVFSL